MTPRSQLQNCWQQEISPTQTGLHTSKNPAFVPGWQWAPVLTRSLNGRGGVLKDARVLVPSTSSRTSAAASARGAEHAFQRVNHDSSRKHAIES